MDCTPAPTEGARSVLIHAQNLRESILAQPQPPGPEVTDFLVSAGARGDHEATAVVHGAVASSYRELQRYEEALDHADRAVGAARHADAGDELARALAIRAMIRFETGNAQAARADLDDAANAGSTDPSVILAAAVVAQQSGEAALATDLLRGLRNRGELGAVLRMKVLNNLGNLYLESRPEAALDAFGEALLLAREASALHAPFIEANIAMAHLGAGRLPEALAAFDRAEAGQVQLTGVGMVGEYHAEVAAVFGRIRLLAEARAAAAQALAGLPAQGGSLMRADALVTAARLAVADGDPAAALTALTEARALYLAQGRPAGSAIAELEILALQPDPEPASVATQADALDSLGLTREAGRAWLRAGTAAARRADLGAAQGYWAYAARPGPGDIVTRLEARARDAISRADLTRAAAEIAEALAVIDGRAALASAPDLRHRIAADRSVFERLLRECLQSRSPAEQLDAILRSRPPADGAGDASVEDAEVRGQWRELARRVESADEDAATLVTLGARLAETERRLRSSAWARGSAGGGRTAYGLGEVAADVGGAVLAVARVAEAALAFHHLHGTTVSTLLGPWARVRADLTHLTRGLSRIATQGRSSGAYDGTWRLAMTLNDAFARVLPAHSQEPLLIIVDRGLDSAPLTALPVLWSRPLRFASLAVTSPVVHSVGPQPDPRVLVAAGPRLPCAEREAAQVAGVWSDLSPPIARESGALRARLPQSEIIHIAAHASLRWDNPLQSVIHLHDGPLALTELAPQAGSDSAGLRLLYLSACSLASAPSDDLLVGAVPMLTERVAREVVACSIPLPDEHAPAIATAVHRAVRDGRGAAAGLAEARLALGSDPAVADIRAAVACVAAFAAAP